MNILKCYLYILIVSLIFNSCSNQSDQYTAKINMLNDKPVLFINDSVCYPLMYSLVGVTGSRFSYDETPAWNIKRFADAGVRIFQAELWPSRLVPKIFSAVVTI